MPHDGTIAVLAYHSLDDSNSVLATSPRVFAEQMRLLHEQQVKVVPLDEVRQALDAGAATEDLVAITFDDGFKSLYQYALPVLQRYGFTATVFLVSDYCGKTNAWPSQPSYIEPGPLLQWAEVKEMSAAGIRFGSHTRTHPDLRTLARETIEEELVISKKAIEDIVGQPVETLAYPYGTYNDVVKQVAGTHFRLACTADLGFAGSESDPYALERLDMYYLRRPALFRRLFSPEMNAYVGLRRYLRHLRRRLRSQHD